MPSFVMRLVAVLAAALSLTACGLTPAQRFGVVAGVLIVGAIAAHSDHSQPQVTGRQPQCLPTNPNHACQ